MEMTYADLHEAEENERQTYMWTMLYATGYLTDARQPDFGTHMLRIPNGEIRQLVSEQVMSWIKGQINNDTTKIINTALETGDAALLQQTFGDFLSSTMSIRDTLAS